jgi:hypothetical protein
MDARGAQAVSGRDAKAFRLGKLGQPLDRFRVVVYE